jgi:hypothetical protein
MMASGFGIAGATRRRVFVSRWSKAGVLPRSARSVRRHVRPAPIGVERDVDAVVVGAKRLLEKSRRADAEAGIATPRLDENALVVGSGLAAREHDLPARNRQRLHDEPGGRLPQPVTHLVVEGDGSSSGVLI